MKQPKITICGVYKIVSPYGKIYIGNSIDISKRWALYKRLNCKRQPKLYASLKKYGVDSHTFEIIEICREKILSEREIYWISFYGAAVRGKGLNCTMGGEGTRGMRHSKKSKALIRQKLLGRVFSPETRELQRKGSLGNTNSVGFKHSEKFREEKRLQRLGKSLPITTRQSMRYAARRAWDKRQKEGNATNKSIRGVSNHNCKLTIESVKEIRQSSLTLKETAERFKVSISTIHLIRTNKTWR